MIEKKVDKNNSFYYCEKCRIPMPLLVAIDEPGKVIECPVCLGQMSLDEFRKSKGRMRIETNPEKPLNDDDIILKDVAGVLRKVCFICDLADTCPAKDFCFRRVEQEKWVVCPEGRITEEHYNNAVEAVKAAKVDKK